MSNMNVYSRFFAWKKEKAKCPLTENSRCHAPSLAASHEDAQRSSSADDEPRQRVGGRLERAYYVLLTSPRYSAPVFQAPRFDLLKHPGDLPG